MRLVPTLFAVSTLFSAILATGCASDETQPATPAGDATWERGDYILTAYAVDDKCLDGAAGLVAIPDSKSREFTNALGFPGSVDESFTTTLALVEPFTATDVTFVKTADATWEWTPKATNTGVDLGQLSDAWAGCSADFEFGGTWNAEKTADGKVRFVGTASFVVTKADGDGCPTLSATPCAITLDMIAAPK